MRLATFVMVAAMLAALPAAVAAAPPSNDDFGNARVIVGSLPYHDTLNPTDATFQGGEAESTCDSSPEPSVWYRFTPVRSGVFRADTMGSDYDANIDVYRGTTLAGLVEIDCNDDIDSWSIYDSRLAFRATGGTRYYIRVSGDEGTHLDFTLRSVQAPSNDQFAGARTISSLPFTANADNINATSQSAEPRQSSLCSVMRATRWYKYTPAHDEVIWANTFTAVDFDTMLAVYRGNKIGNVTEIACNDDQWVSGNRVYSSGITFKALAGVTYRFQVGGYDAESGQHRELPFHVRRLTPAANDDFANATNIAAIPFEHEVHLRHTTRQPSEPVATDCSDDAANTAWYRYVAAADGTVSADVSASDVTPEVAIYESTGPGFGGLAYIDCSTDVDFAVESGKTYYIQVFIDNAVTAPTFLDVEEVV